MPLSVLRKQNMTQKGELDEEAIFEVFCRLTPERNQAPNAAAGMCDSFNLRVMRPILGLTASEKSGQSPSPPIPRSRHSPADPQEAYKIRQPEPLEL
jgi:hypothetical protein